MVGGASCVYPGSAIDLVCVVILQLWQLLPAVPLWCNVATNLQHM